MYDKNTIIFNIVAIFIVISTLFGLAYMIFIFGSQLKDSMEQNLSNYYRSTYIESTMGE